MKKVLKTILLLFLFLNYFYGFSNDIGYLKKEVAFTIYDSKKNISISSYWENFNGNKQLFFDIYKYTLDKNPDENNVEFIERIKVLNNKSKNYKGTVLRPLKGVLINNLLYFSTKHNGIYTFDLETKKMNLFFKTSNRAITRETSEEHLIIDFEIHNNSLIIANKKGFNIYDLITKKIVRKISKTEKIAALNTAENLNFLMIKYDNDKYEVLGLPNFNKTKEINDISYATILENGKLIYVSASKQTITNFNLSTKKVVWTKPLVNNLENFKTQTKIIKSDNDKYIAIEYILFEKQDNAWKNSTRKISLFNLINGRLIEEIKIQNYRELSFAHHKKNVLLKSYKSNYVIAGKIELLANGKYYALPVAHIISVGNNQIYNYICKSCEKEVTNFGNRVSKDYQIITEEEFLDSIFKYEKYNYNKQKVRDVKKHLLAGESASLKNVRLAFKKVIEEAKSNDFFIFHFSGLSNELLENRNTETFLLTYQEDYKNQTELKKRWATELSKLKPIHANFENYELNYWRKIAKNSLTVKELGSLMNQIPINNQLVLSESGNGEKFAQNLIYHLFENNPILAKNNTRNRLILTTKNVGYDGYGDIKTGPLNYLINKKGNLLDIFENTDLYNYELLNTSIKSNRKWFSNYYKIHQEKDYTNFLTSKFKNTNKSRGTVTASNKKEEKKTDNKIKSFALLIANDTFDAIKNWSSLKNPINDVNAVEEILKEKYNTETLILHNKTKNEILKAINNMKLKMDENDQFLFFIAGHGYYSEEMSDGMVVCKESKELEEDYDKSSYLKMADLHRLLNTMPAKNVFAVFDVCFGATFDLFAKDIAINNYNKLQLDIKLEDFIKRKNSETSRIFMASGRYEVPDYWNDTDDHSPFASKLIKAFSEEKDFISPGKIFSYMHGNATEPLLKKFGEHKPRGDFLMKVVN